MRDYLAKRTPEAKAKDSARARSKFYAHREACIQALGGVCKTCGFSDIRALQIDHVNGGGQADRKARGYNSGYPYTFFKKIMADPDFLDKYQVLCANCNWIKRSVNKEYNRGVGSKPRIV